MQLENLEISQITIKQIDLSPATTTYVSPGSPRTRLLVLKKGQLNLNVGSVFATLEKQSLYLIPPQKEFRLRFSPVQELTIMIVEFYLEDQSAITSLYEEQLRLTDNLEQHIDALAQTLQKKNLLMRGKPSQTYDKEIAAYFQVMEATSRQAIRQILITAMEDLYFQKLPPQMREQLADVAATDKHAGESTRKSSRVRYTDDLVNQLVAMMEDRLSENLTIDELAAEFFLSPSTIKKRFKLATNKSIMSYYRDMKMERAKQWIRENQLSYTDIAEKLGYYSIHHFSSVFKKYTGVSPTKYFESKQPNFREKIKETDTIINESHWLS